jgi:hypothetical protein
MLLVTVKEPSLLLRSELVGSTNKLKPTERIYHAGVPFLED